MRIVKILYYFMYRRKKKIDLVDDYNYQNHSKRGTVFIYTSCVGRFGLSICPSLSLSSHLYLLRLWSTFNRWFRPNIFRHKLGRWSSSSSDHEQNYIITSYQHIFELIVFFNDSSTFSSFLDVSIALWSHMSTFYEYKFVIYYIRTKKIAFF